MAAPGRVVELFARFGGGGADIKPARAAQSCVAVFADLLGTPVNKFIDIAVIVGEQDEVLKIAHRCAGVMRQARKRIVGAQPIEERQGHVLFLVELDTVGQFIANQRQIG